MERTAESRGDDDTFGEKEAYWYGLLWSWETPSKCPYSRNLIRDFCVRYREISIRYCKLYPWYDECVDALDWVLSNFNDLPTELIHDVIRDGRDWSLFLKGE